MDKKENSIKDKHALYAEKNFYQCIDDYISVSSRVNLIINNRSSNEDLRNKITVRQAIARHRLKTAFARLDRTHERTGVIWYNIELDKKRFIFALSKLPLNYICEFINIVPLISIEEVIDIELDALGI